MNAQEKVRRRRDGRNLWHCPDCGSTEVQASVWVDANTEECVTKVFDADEYWCHHCEEEGRADEQKWLCSCDEPSGHLCGHEALFNGRVQRCSLPCDWHDDGNEGCEFRPAPDAPGEVARSERQLHCVDCGSPKIQVCVKQWIDANTEEVMEAGDADGYFCPSCDDAGWDGDTRVCECDNPNEHLCGFSARVNGRIQWCLVPTIWHTWRRVREGHRLGVDERGYTK